MGRGDSQYPKYTWAREVPCPLWPLGLAHEATGVQVAQRCPQKLNKQAPHKETQPPCPRGRPHHLSDRGCARVQNTSCSVVKMTPYKAGRSSPTPGHAHACTHVHSHTHACALRAALPRARGGLEQGLASRTAPAVSPSKGPHSVSSGVTRQRRGGLWGCTKESAQRSVVYNISSLSELRQNLPGTVFHSITT